MAIERKVIVYQGPGGPFEGMAVRDSGVTGDRPAILLFPNVLGTKESDFVRAERVAALGYVVLVADVYGQGKRTTRTSPDPAIYMTQLAADRGLLKQRLLASLETIRALPDVNAQRIGAIGYCFGGKCVLDLVRAGADIRGGVSFHGVYDPPPFKNASITAKLLICHGWNDPLCPPDATVALATELTDAKADWQIHAYGNTSHGFTDESANIPERGIMFQPDAERRSWQAMLNFFSEIF